MNFLKAVLIGLLCINCAYAWDSEQLEVFDVVDEVKVNFYEMLNISKDADSRQIRSSFRNLSLVLHPDKNMDVDTSEQFRNLVSVYEVLKDPVKRKYYDEVLINGLPNWRSAVYYYRHARKMGMIEITFILFAFITIGQYLVAWASYLETLYTLSQRKITKKEKNMNIVIDIPKPSFVNTLPVQIPKLIFFILISLPKIVQFFKQKAIEKVEEAMAPQESSSEEEVVVEPKQPRRRKPAFVVPEGPTFEVQKIKTEQTKEDITPPPVTGGLWTDDDLAELIQLVKKYPGGTPGRWDLIAEACCRSVSEVTYMANKLKNNAYKMPTQEEEPVEQPKIKQKTKGGKLGAGEVNTGSWSQIQQKALEEALSRYPKGAADRWDKIADCVPNKTKEECMLRFKHLAEMIKKQKETQEQNGAKDKDTKESDEQVSQE